MPDRRTILRGLAALPLIGGSVALIGRPTAAAVPVTDALLTRYEMWLDVERSRLRFEMWGQDSANAPELPYTVVFQDRRTGRKYDRHYVSSRDFDHEGASSRAAIVLSAVGCPLTNRGARG